MKFLSAASDVNLNINSGAVSAGIASSLIALMMSMTLAGKAHWLEFVPCLAWWLDSLLESLLSDLMLY